MENKRIDFRDQISKNKRKSLALMIIIFLVIMLLGYVFARVYSDYFFVIILFSVIVSISYTFFSYYNSDKIAIFSVGAKEADKEIHKDYYRVVEGLAIASGLPMPKIYVMPSPQINAFASGRDPQHAVICITRGALEQLDKKELEGVIAHEMGHIQSYDIRYITLVSVMVGMISILSEFFLRSLWYRDRGNDKEGGDIFVILGILLAILAPIFVFFVQMAISRKREFSADASAVKFTRYPAGLIRALQKIQDENTPSKRINKALAPLFFSDPIKNLSSTHPSIEKRIDHKDGSIKTYQGDTELFKEAYLGRASDGQELDALGRMGRILGASHASSSTSYMDTVDDLTEYLEESDSYNLDPKKELADILRGMVEKAHTVYEYAKEHFFDDDADWTFDEGNGTVKLFKTD